MSFAFELPDRVTAAREARTAIEAEEADWRRRWEAADDFGDRTKLAAEDATSNRPERLRAINGELAHLKVLLDLHMFSPEQSYSDDARPAFAMAQSDLQDYLQEWILQTITSRDARFMMDSMRLILGWSAQLLVGQAPHSPDAVYPRNFQDAARSIYAYAVSDEMAAPTRNIVGRNRHDAHILLAHAAFPFLEGMARRRLPSFMTGSGKALIAFDVNSKSGKKTTYEKGCNVNNLAQTLQLLEREAASEDFHSRMSCLRAEIASRGVEQDVKAISGDETDFYAIIFAHRNSNLHGGAQLYPVGLASLLLATMIGLDAIQNQFDELRNLAHMVTSSQAPVNPKEAWPHWIFYPVPFSHSYNPENVHQLPNWQL